MVKRKTHELPTLDQRVTDYPVVSLVLEVLDVMLA